MKLIDHFKCHIEPSDKREEVSLDWFTYGIK